MPAKKGKKSKKVKKIAKARRLAAPKKKAKKKAAKPRASAKIKKQGKPIGKVTHFYGNISVAIVKFNQKVSAGTELHFKGATTDFKETAKSMQYNHEAIAVASKGKQIGIKVKKKVREGDSVYKAE
jgi:putative protease